MSRRAVMPMSGCGFSGTLTKSRSARWKPSASRPSSLRSTRQFFSAQMAAAMPSTLLRATKRSAMELSSMSKT